ncbi:MAG: FG-GAP-like repeat-containing protein [Myxococcota bacterium]
MDALGFAGADGSVRDEGLDPADARTLEASPVPDGPAPAAPLLRFPWNGYTTGSPHVPLRVMVDHPLQPQFRWEPLADAEFELQLTQNCGTDFRACDFDEVVYSTRTTNTAHRVERPLPVSRSTPVGSRYYWRLRACRGANCSPWSEVRYVDVGRSMNDYNGDGIADLAVGAPGAYDGRGAVVVYRGGGHLAPRPQVTVRGPSEGLLRFGTHLAALGDVDGDGFSDLLVVPSWTQGSVYLVYGSADIRGLQAEALEAPPSVSSLPAGTACAALGDVNGDGFADFAVGMRDGSGGDSSAHVYFGGAALGAPMRLPVPEGIGADGDALFGAALAGLGDLNGDGYADFAVAAPFQNSATENTGSTHVFFGGASRSYGSVFSFPNPLPFVGSFGAELGGTGDLDGDGFADLVVGAPSQPIVHRGSGATYILFGSRVLASSSTADLESPDPRPSGSFGRLGAMPDINGDGLTELVVGEQGSVFIYNGGGTYESADDQRVAPATQIFGIRLTALDQNGDGFDDVVVAASERSGDSSERLMLFQGAADGLSETPIVLESPFSGEVTRFGSLP